MCHLSSSRPRRQLRLIVSALALAGLAFVPTLAHAGASASGSLGLSTLTATASSGTIAWSGTWSISSFASASNSFGELAFDFSFDASSASASAAVTYASGHASGSVQGPGAPTANVNGSLALPGGFEASASVYPASTTLDTTFSITGTSGIVDVSFSALLSSALASSAGLDGEVLQNDVIFNLNVDGNNVLSYFDQAVVGPGAALSLTSAPALSGTISLDATAAHSLVLSLEHDPLIHTTSVPDGTPTGLLLAFCLILLVQSRRIRR